MEIKKLDQITIIATEGLLPPMERLCGNVLLCVSAEDRAELERIAHDGIAPLMELGFSQAMAQRIRKALGIRTYTGASATTQWRITHAKELLDQAYAEHRLTPVAPDRACGSAGDDEGSTRAAGEHDG